MGSELDLDDVSAGHPLAQAELKELYAELAFLRARAERLEKELRDVLDEIDAYDGRCDSAVYASARAALAEQEQKP